ncbi:helix-turn-helix and ligand-binding sensor domain-containing protein [Pareuzebyella sediminis]|uniref:helix-turn-helix and ligand-binding sensor domain-containing protein n=1 Tax=Pareuzebyella sediminis TaxID=2607998 RepID=UPI0011ED3E7B|nr:triple tyrosine motif-containing protein [Pareuzebyella sediminis]
MTTSRLPKSFTLLFSIVTTLISYYCFGQDLPSIKNFHPTDYNAENQNWAVSQSPEKLIYVANSKGLLEFNGAYWKTYLSPNESIMRSVKVVDERIYTGCYMEFGFWEKNQSGNLTYTSISQEIDVDIIEDEEFWGIINIDNLIIFQSLKRIYIFNVEDKSISTIDSESRITKIFNVDEEVYFQKFGEGIFTINEGEEVLFLDDDVFKIDEVVNIFGSREDFLILTKDNGFYKLNKNVAVKSKSSSNEILSKVSVYDGIKLNDNKLALGTIADGLFILDEREEIISHINYEQGLINNTVLAVFEDVTNNIWLGLDNGICYINTNSPYELHYENKGILGSVYVSIIHDGNLYLGTNQGLFYKKLNSNDNFGFIEGTQGQVWSLKEIEGTLFCGHNAGTFIIESTQAKKISNVQGTWKIAQIDDRAELLLQGNYDGLYVLEKYSNGWRLRNKIKGFNNSSRYFEILKNEIFVNHEYKGIFKLKIDKSYFAVEEVSIDTTLKGSNSGITKYNQDLLYSYKQGIFKYDTVSKTFIKDNFLSKVYTPKDYESGKLIVDENANILWVFTKSNITYITPTGLTDEKRIKTIPLSSKIRNSIIGYENISALNSHTYLTGATSGYIIVDTRVSKTENFSVRIGHVLNGSNNTVYEEKNIDSKGLYSSDQKNFDISFYTPEFNKYVKPEYQFQLLGIYDAWSDWSENSTASFDNLPYGKYTFNVRARIGDTVSNNISTYTFEIKKPWYISNVMLSLNALGILAFLLLSYSMYNHYYKKQRRELIIKNEKELKLTKIQNEQEITKLKNEKLKVDFQSKSKELAASLMSIAKKNDLLRTVKEKLRISKGANDVNSVVGLINKNLGQNDDWEFFQEAFNNADSNFLKKLKECHPTLTPNDLKLCGYLRLNLSTKEIAKLLNIAPRSVEIKRYRLRKKLDLVHKENLVNYILEL